MADGMLFNLQVNLRENQPYPTDNILPKTSHRQHFTNNILPTTFVMSVFPNSPILLSLETAIDYHPVTVTPQTLLLEAIAMMQQESNRCTWPELEPKLEPELEPLKMTEAIEQSKVSYLVVVDQRKPIGLLTERDLVRFAAQGMNLAGLTVTEVMTQDLITARKSQLHDIFQVLNIFREHRIRHLPILTETDEFLGVLSLEGMREALQTAYLLKLRRVAEVMTTATISAPPTASVREVAQLMNQHQISCVVIGQRIGESELVEDPIAPVGIITERDIVQLQILQLDLDQISAATVMSTPVWSVKPEDSLWLVHQKMRQHRVRHLLVCQRTDTPPSRLWRHREKPSSASSPSSEGLGLLLGIVTQSSIMQVLEPREMFSMIHLLHQEVSEISQEKLQLLNNCKTSLEQQVQERTAQIQAQADCQRLLATVAQRIRQSLNLEEILATTVKEVRQLLACDRVMIYRCDPTNKGGISPLSVETESESPLPLQICEAFMQLSTGGDNFNPGIRAIADTYTDNLTPVEIGFWQELGLRASLLVPIIQTSQEDKFPTEFSGTNSNLSEPPKYWGFLIAGECDRPRQWQESQMELLEQLATQLAIAIQQSTLLQQVQAELEERQQAEKALAEQHNLVSAILDVIGALVVVLDREGRILKFNQACEKTTGYTFDEVVGRCFWDFLLLPEEMDGVRDIVRQLKEGDFPNQHQNHWVTKDRQLCWISWSNTCLTNAQGEVEYLIATGIDITEKYQAEMALKQLNEELELRVEQRTAALQNLNYQLNQEICDRLRAEKKFQRLLAAVEAASDGIAILTDNKYQYLNQSHAQMFGYENAAELLGKQWLGFYSAEESERLVRNIFPQLKEQKYWRGEAIAQRQDGSKFIEEISLTLTQNGDLVCVCRNIEDRKKMEKTLQSSEARFRAIFEQAAVGITLFNLEGNLLKSNQKFREILGYREDEIVQKNIVELTYPEDLPKLYTSLKALCQRQIETFSSEERCLRKDRSIIWANITVSLVSESAEDPDYFLCVVQDISDRKQAAVKLQKVLQELAYHKQALDQFAIVTITDAKGVITYVNDKFCEISGYTEAEAIGKTHALVNSGYHPKDFFKNLWSTISQGKIWQSEVKNKRKNGQDYWVDTTIVPFLNDQGKPFQYLAIRIDITERKIAEQKIQQRESQMTAQYKGIPVPTYTWQKVGDDLMLIDYNHASETITDGEIASLLGIKVSTMYKDHPQIIKDFWKCFQNQQTLQREYWGQLSPSSEPKYFIINYVFVPPDLVMVHTQDLTEREQAKALIQASLKEKEVLLKEIHHRVKNNLQVISSLLDLQSQYIEDPALLSQFEDSQNRIQSMALIHEKLYQSNDLSHINFADYVESLVDHLFLSYGRGKHQIKPKINIGNLSLNLDTAIPCGLIINELVSNALKHGFPQSDPGDTPGEISVEIYPGSDLDHFTLVISDNGIGFPAALDFQNIESSLGLQLVCTLTQQLRGKIELNRTQGTQFKLTLSQIKKNQQS
jgi:PAS domain S-box-containing protein